MRVNNGTSPSSIEEIVGASPEGGQTMKTNLAILALLSGLHFQLLHRSEHVKILYLIA
jgi:hypothetical protein